MSDAFENRVVLTYLHNLSWGLPEDSRCVATFCRWVTKHGAQMGLPLSESEVDQEGPPWGDDFGLGDSQGRKYLSVAEARGLIDSMTVEQGEVEPGPLEKNLQSLATIADLDRLDKDLVGLAIRYRQIEQMNQVLDRLYGTFELPPHRIIATALGANPDQVLKRLSPEGSLIRAGLLAGKVSTRPGLAEHFHVQTRPCEALSPPIEGAAAIFRRLVGEPIRPSVDWVDFEHIQDQRDFVRDLLQAAVRRNARGVNVLVHGQPGTGKTEFAAVVAARLRLTLCSSGEGIDGAALDRDERLSALQLSQRLLARQRRTLLLVDEAEDLVPGSFASSSTRSVSRLRLNRLLETNPVPTIYCANDVGVFGKAMLRRFTLAVEIRSPTKRVREQVWRRLLKRERLRLPDCDVTSLATTFSAPPALAANAVRAAKLAGGGFERVHRAVAGVARAMGHAAPWSIGTMDDLPDLSLLNAGTDLHQLAERLATSPERRFSLLLSGPAGTGKSVFARYLADRLGLPVLQKRGSDLLRSFLGETEKAITEAFEAAREEGAFLVFDEADSLLSDRRHAVRNWEISQVNELLQAMEHHSLPFAATTNFDQRLDPASLRRFTFKIQLQSLRSAQLAAAFKRFFNVDPPVDVCRCKGLTVGDFALVQRKARLLGVTDPHELAQLLGAEAEAKLDRARPIGYLTA